MSCRHTPLPLQDLHLLLKEDVKRRKEDDQEKKELEKKSRRLKSAIQEIWQASLGGEYPLVDQTDHSFRTWVRPLPPSLFKCPLSHPQTTLASWGSLPAKVQEKVRRIHNISDDQIQPGLVVEVPLSYLTPEDPAMALGSQSSSSAAGILNKRPLGGNLTNKLSEYTRGMAGQSRPFRPGGLDVTEGSKKKAVDASEPVDPHRTPEAVERAQKPLVQGIEASWKDKSLITAPPGVDFLVGLGWEDIHGDDPGQGNQSDATKLLIGQEDESYDFTSRGAAISTSISGQANLFNRAYFDDDSLFGPSSEEGEEEEGVDLEDDDIGDGVDKNGEEDEGEGGARPVQSALLSSSHQSSLANRGRAYDSPEVAGDDTPEETDVDKLLAELSISDDHFFSKRTKMTEVDINPLLMAEKHAEDQSNSNRKEWASTKLLPIRDFNSLIPNPALTYPFTLDGFQQQAVARLERSESVFVAAHTSAGKTVVAEYAVALSRKHGTRCIYTSPIKALSNQKFRDFSLKFGAKDVGLVTGDLQVNVDGSTCIIMTTEILRSMLYRGADLIRDIEWVVFDEVHYVNDQERGVVWEEVIIMLPSYVGLIFLSATTPNTLEFADWVGRTKRRPVYVVKTDYRPVPLSHHLWAGLKLHKIREASGPFIEQGYAEAADSLLPSSAKDPNKKNLQKGRATSIGSKQLAWQQQGDKNDWMSLIRFLDREFLTPTVVFSFSKKKCEEIADMLRSLDLNTAKERSAVQGFTLQTVGRLTQVDGQLPQVQTICEMVQRGIGVHHGGLLPIMKEMVEILFSRNLIKVLFATETFAMGVNMPTRCVVFNSIRKHDGNGFRVLEAGEYTQMAGRAGRRGLDTVGTVIICCFGETPPPQPILRQVLTGSSTQLRSQFRLSYNMILNLLRVEELSVESMIKRSFSEFATQRALTANEYPQLLARGIHTLNKIEKEFLLEQDTRMGVEDIEDYFATTKELKAITSGILRQVRENEGPLWDDLFPPGRIILVTAARQHGFVRAPAMVIRSDLPQNTKIESSTTHAVSLICLVLLPSSFVANNLYASKDKPRMVGYVGTSQQRHYAIHRLQLEHVFLVTSLKYTLNLGTLVKDDMAANSSGKGTLSTSFDFRSDGNPFSGMKALGKKRQDEPLSTRPGVSSDDQTIDLALTYLKDAEKLELGDAGLSPLDLRPFLKRGSEVVQFRRDYEQVISLLEVARSMQSHRHPNLEKYYKAVERKEALKFKVETLRHLLSSESLQLFPDYLQRKSVLERLGYIDDHEAVCLKGRVACEVNTCEELIVTELVFEGLLNDLEPEEIAAVLSALVFQEKNNDESIDAELPEKLVLCCEQMKQVARNLGQLQKEHGLDIDPLEFCDRSLKFGLVHVTYEWALGVSFKSICELTNVQEGSIVRCITRLDELCREVRNCARVVGNPTLYRKLEAASAAIKRDIVFASSLYVS